MKKLRVIAFDADDTLWVNEPIFTMTHVRFKKILSNYVQLDDLDEKLYGFEIRNLNLFGYGIKGFMLSMIETAIEITQGKISGSGIQQLINIGKEMLAHPVELLPNVENTIKALQDQYTLLIITKGDLFDQESKIARSGIADYFDKIEIVSEKDEDTYRRVIKRNNIKVDEFLMVGNSLKSDILPVCNIGAGAVYIPYHITWAHEMVTIDPSANLAYQELPDISLLPKYLQRLNSKLENA